MTHECERLLQQRFDRVGDLHDERAQILDRRLGDSRFAPRQMNRHHFDVRPQRRPPAEVARSASAGKGQRKSRNFASDANSAGR